MWQQHTYKLQLQHINVSDRYRAHNIHKNVIYISGNGNNKDINFFTKTYSHTGKQMHCKPMHYGYKNSQHSLQMTQAYGSNLQNQNTQTDST